jgi:hypothetical protein
LALGDFTLGIGGTLDTYTGDFDDTYKEVNFSAGWSWLTSYAADGTYDNFDGTYFEAGHGNTLSVGDTDLLDYVFTVIHSDEDLAGSDSSDTNLVLTLPKSFGL